ncbi:GNAT family N-acetyltransferase [Sphingomonas changnyeongensis]|uniref:GNAT family N-acetyltransferase n=1 Tax=Sphingomonas changnyeongensis TaxID=2698679 RepID=A0A7Z2NWJ3_9SPHN|nr:GNAT family N-acetyltransferase [Sphingomonas changnyeongensis]QHL90827.1 GNAT family N-acetyltransferase [Sphingomonas changnyeongensis]
MTEFRAAPPPISAPSAPPVIRTARLTLRPATMEDLEPLHAVLSDARAMRYWATLPHRALDETRDWLQAMIDAPAGEGEDWIITHRGTAIGKAGLWRFPEIGFILHPDRWGQGLAGEAVAAVIDRAFAVHRLPRITADVDPRNTASLRLLARLGFVETGRASRTLRLGDEWCDSVYLELAAPGPDAG